MSYRPPPAAPLRAVSLEIGNDDIEDKPRPPLVSMTTYAIINHNSVSQCLSSIKNVSGEPCNDNKDWRERERRAGG